MTQHGDIKLTAPSRAWLWLLFLNSALAAHVWAHEESGPARWAIAWMVEQFHEVSRKMVWAASSLTGLAVFVFGAIALLQLGVIRTEPPVAPGVIGGQWLVKTRAMLSSQRWTLGLGLIGLELCVLGISIEVSTFRMGPPVVCDAQTIAAHACDDRWAHFPGSPSYADTVLTLREGQQLTDYLQLREWPHVFIARERFDGMSEERPARLISGHVKRMPLAHYLLLRNEPSSPLPARDEIRVLDSEDFALGAAAKALCLCLTGLIMLLIARRRYRKSL